MRCETGFCLVTSVGVASFALLVAAGCSNGGRPAAGPGGTGGATGGNTGSRTGGVGGGAPAGGPQGSGGRPGSDGAAGGGGTDGGGVPGGPPPPAAGTFCARWKALAPGALPGFATDSACADYTDIPTGGVTCSGAMSASATVGEVLLGQNHLLPPSAENYAMNEAGTFAMAAGSVRPKFRLVSHRPALLKVAVTGTGAAPEVKVIATRNGAPVGALCLQGPAALPATVSPIPSFADSFTVQLPAAWIRPGLALQIQAGAASKTIPTADLRVAGGLRHLVVEVPALVYADTTPHFVPQYMPRMADELPVQSLVWSHFPVPMVLDPFVMSARSGQPDRVVARREGNFDEVGEVLDIGGTIRAANGHSQEASYFIALDPRYWGGGLGGGGLVAAGPASQLMIRHEGGHTYGLPHMEDAYRQQQYPFAKRTDGSGCVLGVPLEDGCGVGPYWKYFQYFGVVQSRDETVSFASPWDRTTPGGAAGAVPGVYLRDPMAGGGDNWFGAYTVQWVLDFMQGRVFWDDERSTYVSYDPATGEFVPDTSVRNGGYYDRPIQRDVPVYTIFGSISATVPAARAIQPPMHYRGNLLKTLDPTSDVDLGAARQTCSGGCNYTVRVTFDGSKVRSYLVRNGTVSFLRFAINVADDGKVTSVEIFQRPFTGTGATAATFLDGATLLASRAF
jgi:hypothetical protein